MNTTDAKRFEELSAYHDGELGGLARLRFERRLRQSPELRRELAELSRIGRLVREREPQAAAPDLWDRIEQHLPAVDFRRREADRETEDEGGAALGWLWRPLGAVAAAAVAVFAVYSVYQVPVPEPGAVRWMDAGDRSVMVLEEADMTVIWMLDDAADNAAVGGSGEVA